MKRIFTLLVPIAIGILTTASVFLPMNTIAQAPEKISYQAVIRNSNNDLVTNSQVSMQTSILQGSASGTAVYIEKQSPTANANGLVSMEIGSGIAIFGNFATIDWANGPYFIKVETDPTGGINYTVTGTSQLLSVPYALQAKTAETVTGGITETDPTYTSSQAANITATDITNLSNLSGTNTGDQDLSGLATKTDLGDSTAQVRSEIPDVSGFVTSETDPTYTASQAANITATDITNLSNLSGVNTGDQDGSETKISAGTNITVTGSGTIANPYVVNENVHYIGESYGGGVVFYVYDSGQHGLIVAPADQYVRWYAGTITNTMAYGDGVGAGKANTAIIIANQGYGDGATYAARVCNEYSDTVAGVIYGDWYLPSKYELNLLYQQKNVVGSFTNTYYWSSTVSDTSHTWIQNFYDGLQKIYNQSYNYHVRAIRAF